LWRDDATDYGGNEVVIPPVERDLREEGYQMGGWEQVLHLFLVIVIATLGGLILGGLALIGLVRLQIRNR